MRNDICQDSTDQIIQPRRSDGVPCHKPNAILIGRNAGRSRDPERRSPTPAAREHARQPIPRRIPNEFYPTPPEAVRALLSVEQFDGSIWEPACGEGAIAKVLSDAGHDVVSTDRYDYGCGETGVDFLSARETRALATSSPIHPTGAGWQTLSC